MNLSELTGALLAPFTLLFDPSERLSLFYQLTALLFAVGVYVHSRAGQGKLHPAGLVRWLLPRDVLLHPSAVTDYGFFLASKILAAAIYGSILITGTYWTGFFADLITSAFGPWPVAAEPSPGLTLVCTLVIVLVMDATLWWAHYLFHVVPILWQFHKVHHSAEVMTPITAARMHPVEEIFDSALVGLTVGLAGGILQYFLGSAAKILLVGDLNLFFFVFLVIAFNLRHSHVWLRYPKWIEHIFVSPAQHQVHHSVAREHWDRNMGFIFAFWDWAAGTLVVTERNQKITFGLGTREDGTWRGVGTLFFRPFRECYEIVRARQATHSPKNTRTAPGAVAPE